MPDSCWRSIETLPREGKNALPWNEGSLGDCSLTRIAMRFGMDGRKVSYCEKTLASGRTVYFLRDNYFSSDDYWRVIPKRGILSACTQEELEEILTLIEALSARRNVSPRIATDRERIAAIAQKMPHYTFTQESNEDWFDYYYQSRDFARLVGRPLAKKRNFCRRFANRYPRAQFVVYRTKPEENVMQKIRAFLDDWYEAYPRKTDSLMREKRFLYRILDSETEEVWGLGLLCDGETIVGMSLGAFATDDVFVVHFEKARKDYEGAYPYLAHSFARALCCAVFLNREEDLGIPGLRKAKHDWHPVRMGRKGLFSIARK